jgi:hypothetical protein
MDERRRWLSRIWCCPRARHPNGSLVIEREAKRVCVNVDFRNILARRLYASCSAQILDKNWMVWDDLDLCDTYDTKHDDSSLCCMRRHHDVKDAGFDASPRATSPFAVILGALEPTADSRDKTVATHPELREVASMKPVRGDPRVLAVSLSSFSYRIIYPIIRLKTMAPDDLHELFRCG